MFIETARGMLKDKLDKKLITKYTGLTSEEIEAIALWNKILINKLYWSVNKIKIFYQKNSLRNIDFCDKKW